ncbi:aminotransferase class I/II-fold pyridoxal phosphate-dependent enzyme [Psychrobacillus vulpis]|uniref:Aminotransferase class I/II-fold pyridoxal phosphate-dependent enzyme n=1 Tax=Psychrobacillus vulpis TaxID=2325572 RepID=A0A544TL99_9BACI|nr:aminotransferase class I/II-fold pyridoxal phosphate-dependent enzyme [Psychrobacillus vulpis]TQR18222.1 aminotransferase class I/II-fold pyridoxal phosphate-dependent enzyme [Psychrobacillus vulpis]
MQQKRPLVEALEKFHNQKNISFHVPGHKNGLLSNLPNAMKNSMQYDFTELNGLDDYHHPEEAIKEAEELLAEVYGAQKSFFLVNGTTVGNLAMIYASCQYGEQIIVQRNAHKSIFHAIELVGAEPIFVTPEWDDRTKTASYVSAEIIQEALEKHPFTKAVVLTYPNYYGVATSHLESIISICHATNIPVLVDEAHGAHFHAHNNFPKSALQLGADVTVQSAHKTLPALTMGSFLHVNSSLIDVSRVNKYLRMLQSSSPSYLLLASLDDARSYVDRYNEMDFKQFLNRRKLFIESLETLKDIKVVQVDDPLKLLIRVGKYSGFQVQSVLEKQNIYVELADTYQVLLILPLLKVEHEFGFAEIRKRIKHALDKLRIEIPMSPKNTQLVKQKSISTLHMNLSLLNEKRGEWIPYVRSLGRIAKGMIIPYPPGIPLVIAGEKITIAMLTELEEWMEKGALFQGEHRLNEKLIYVVEE